MMSRPSRQATRAPTQVVDRGDGTYQAEFRTSVSGTYQINVTLHGAHVARSPCAPSLAAFNSSRVHLIAHRRE